MKHLYFVLIALLVIPFPYASVSAEKNLDLREQELSRQILCPTCQGQAIDSSNSQLAQNMRDELKHLLTENKSEEEILTYFARKYGENVILKPSKNRANLPLWILPIIIFSTLILIMGVRFNFSENTK